MSDNLYAVYTAGEVIAELDSRLATLTAERNRYRRALVEINEKSTLSLHNAERAPAWIRAMFSTLAGIATAALKEKE
jgi:hypothetical protein